MHKPLLTMLVSIVLSVPTMAQEDEPTSEQVMPGRAGEILGMNVRGNKESPLTLTIVPWRSAEHNQQDPEIRPGWSPQLKLLQPAAYRRSINAFLISRKVRSPAQAEGRQNENQ